MIICICGKTGSGKSTLSNKILDSIPNSIHIDIDKIAHQVNDYPEVKIKLVKSFGKDILTNNLIDRKKLGKIVFNNKDLMKKLKEITWLYIDNEIKRLINDNKDKVILLDYFAIYITDYFKKSDIKILLDINEDIRRERILKRDNISLDKFIEREKNTLNYNPNDFDYVLDENTNLDKFINELKQLYLKKVS